MVVVYHLGHFDDTLAGTNEWIFFKSKPQPLKMFRTRGVWTETNDQYGKPEKLDTTDPIIQEYIMLNSSKILSAIDSYSK